MNAKQFEKVFPLGSHLCREPMPAMSELKKDMEILKKHGFNLIKLQEHWAIDEPWEGHYDFSRYEELIRYAGKLDMGVYLGLTCEQAPAWLWRKYPEYRMVGRNGQPVFSSTAMPADGKPGPCYDHPGAMEKQIKFIKNLVQTLGVFENIVVWNTWQEIAYWAEAITGQDVCYCEYTLNFYRQWLEERYGDLDKLNKEWNTRYGDWKDISPARQKRTLTPQDFEWEYFMENVQIARVLKKRASAIREADALKRPVFAHKAGPIIGSGVDWTYARCQDFLGASCYPAWSPFHAWDDKKQFRANSIDKYTALYAEMWNGVALCFDYIRSCNPRENPVWAAEFQGGPVSTGFHKGRIPSADDIRRWMLTAIGSGVTAISFWVTRAEIMAVEANGFSLLDSVGDSTERFEEASRVGKALNKHPELFSRPTLDSSKVGILINEWNYRFCQSMAQGGDHLFYSTRGWHRLLWESGVPVDFVDISELDEKHVNQYKALILPFPISLSEDMMRKCSRYVVKGGNLISEACPGRSNEYAFCNRGELSSEARELFGVSQKEFIMVREPEKGKRWSPQERTWSEYLDETMLSGCGQLKGYKLRANVYIETFECKGSKPILTYNDSIAGTVNKVGKGKAWLLGTFAGHNGTAYCDKETRALVRALFEQCGIAPGHKGKLLLRKRITEKKEAWIFTNPTEDDLVEQINIEGYKAVEDLLDNKIECEENCIKLKINSLDVRVLILTRIL